MINIKHFFNQRHITPPKHSRLREDRFTTVIIDCPSNAELLKKAKNFMDGVEAIINLNIGLSKCHPDDNFNKKVGVATAADRAKKQDYRVNYLVAALHPGSGEVGVRIWLESLSPTDLVRSLLLEAHHGCKYPEISAVKYSTERPLMK